MYFALYPHGGNSIYGFYAKDTKNGRLIPECYRVKSLTNIGNEHPWDTTAVLVPVLAVFLCASIQRWHYDELLGLQSKSKHVPFKVAATSVNQYNKEENGEVERDERAEASACSPRKGLDPIGGIILCQVNDRELPFWLARRD